MLDLCELLMERLVDLTDKREYSSEQAYNAWQVKCKIQSHFLP